MLGQLAIMKALKAMCGVALVVLTLGVSTNTANSSQSGPIGVGAPTQAYQATGDISFVAGLESGDCATISDGWHYDGTIPPTGGLHALDLIRNNAPCSGSTPGTPVWYGAYGFNASKAVNIKYFTYGPPSTCTGIRAELYDMYNPTRYLGTVAYVHMDPAAGYIGGTYPGYYGWTWGHLGWVKSSDNCFISGPHLHQAGGHSGNLGWYTNGWSIGNTINPQAEPSWNWLHQLFY